MKVPDTVKFCPTATVWWSDVTEVITGGALLTDCAPCQLAEAALLEGSDKVAVTEKPAPEE